MNSFEIMSILLDDGNGCCDRFPDWCGGTGWWPWMFIMFLIMWLVLLGLAILVCIDARKRGMNCILWFILIIIPCLGFLFVIIYLIVRKERTGTKPSTSKKSARAILDERYARGDITRKEYLRMKQDLKE